MTVKQKRALTLGLVLTILAGVLTPTILGAARTAWDAKVDTTRYEMDRRTDSLRHVADKQADSTRWATLRSTQLDILCSPNVNPTNRACK